ncbi:MAG: chorismate synthase [Chitinophagaceae bacterium]
MNTLGTLFKVTSFGESHGSHVGCVIDGCPAGIELNLQAIQQQVDRRKTAQQTYASARNEEDHVQIISGLLDTTTLGSPICILIQNRDAKSDDYNHLINIFRPNHADFTNEKKYGIRDIRGGGRSSIRITAPLVAAGDIARQLIQKTSSIECLAFVKQIGPHGISPSFLNHGLHQDAIDLSAVRCPEKECSDRILQYLSEIQQEGDTAGGNIQVVVKNVPIGLGEPLFNKLQAQLAHAMLSINSVKGFSYGDGFDSVSQKGSEHNDELFVEDNNINTKSNHSGGIQGGISNGQDILFQVAFKPISSIQKEQNTITSHGVPTKLKIKGRHDVCAVPRAVPIVEAYTYLILADAIMHHKLSKL